LKEGGKKSGHRGDQARQKGLSRGVETMYHAAYRTHLSLTAIADRKANMIIGVNGIIESVLIGALSTKFDTNPWLLLPFSVLVLFCLISSVYAIRAARPRVGGHSSAEGETAKQPVNILFFTNFVPLGEDRFVEGMRALSQDEKALYDTMSRDIFGLGSVLVRKYKLLNTSYTLFMVGLVAGVVLFLGIFALEAWGVFG